MKSDTLNKIKYGSGESLAVMGITVIGLYFLYFLTDVVGMSPALAGTIFMIGRSWDAISDPIVGMISDKTKSRWGRRRPYFLITAVPLFLTFLLLWQTVDLSSSLTFIYYALVYMLFMTVLTMFHVPYISLITEYSTDYKERTSINNYRIFFQLFFGLVAATVPKMIADATSYSTMAMVVGIFMLLLALSLFQFTKDAPQSTATHSANFWHEFKSVFRNRGMRYLLVIYVGAYAAANVIESFVIYYMKYYLNREVDMPILFVTVIGVGILSIPIWSKITHRIGKNHALLYGLAIWIVGQVLWLVISPDSPGFLVYIVGGIVGIGYGVAHVLPWAMLPDVVDIDELETGQKREGVYSGIMMFFMKLANSLAIFFIGLILEFAGYIGNAVQSAETLTTIKWTMAFAPGVFLIVAIIATWKYPFSQADHESIRHQIANK